MKVAIVHYWIVGNRGGEKVVEAICRIFPDADIFTLFYDAEAAPALFRTKNVHTSFLNPFKKFYRSLLPLAPMALENFDLRAYDLVISSESGPAKGVLTSSTARHICYCHTPMRYLWELYPAYRAEFRQSLFSHVLMAPVTNYLRMWDYATAARVDQFAANSINVKRRIWKTYRRKSRVIYPPVAIDSFQYSPSSDFFLIVSEMVAYKRLDYAIRVFARTGRRLKVVGDGPEYRYLRKLAGPNVEFCGRVTDHELRQLYAKAKGLILPGEEDFGITMVESLASGKPVIAFGRGGAVEIVENGCGLLYSEPTEASLEEALLRFDRIEARVDPLQLQARAAAFSESAFNNRFRAFVFRHDASDGDSAQPQASAAGSVYPIENHPGRARSSARFFRSTSNPP